MTIDPSVDNTPYTFGLPIASFLKPMQYAKVLAFRGRVQDARDLGDNAPEVLHAIAEDLSPVVPIWLVPAPATPVVEAQPQVIMADEDLMGA